MAEHDPLVLTYVHLAKMPRASEALHTLKKIASLVKPIMRARGWKVRELAEFYPQQQNLLGLNVDRGRKICLRLRYPGDQTQFMPLESVLDTMLHELCHIVHGPHNSEFHALWDRLRDEQQGLMMKGYTGEGFLSEGRRLGGARLPPHEARRLAREAAEKRRRQPSGTGPGVRLGGGSAPRPGQDMRRAMADAAERRKKTLEGCATGNLSEGQMRDVADTATRNGFRTQAEEDEANEVAIAQAMWELAQEEGNPRQVSAATSTTASSSSGRRDDDAVDPPPSQGEGSKVGDSWACRVCTLHNPISFLCCEVCGAERGANEMPLPISAPTGPSSAAPTTRKRASEVIDLTSSPPRQGPREAKRGQAGDTSRAVSRTEVPPAPVQPVWQCSFCGKLMERKWWTCSICGRMKDSSR